MITRILALLSVVLMPSIAAAASLKEFVEEDIIPLGDAVIALFYGLAFLFFLFGMFRYFFSMDAEERQKGKSFAIWGIVGLVVLFGVWGFVKILLSIVGV